jgi:hypothetical protein
VQSTVFHLSSEAIDLLLLQGLGDDETSHAHRHLDECAFCRQRWLELNEDSQRFRRFVFGRTLPSVEARLAVPPVVGPESSEAFSSASESSSVGSGRGG